VKCPSSKTSNRSRCAPVIPITSMPILGAISPPVMDQRTGGFKGKTDLCYRSTPVMAY